MKGNLLLLVAVSLAVEVPLFSQEETKAGKSDRNVMLNAESASVPREINIGLPESGDGAALLVDGIKHAYGLPKSQFHWSGGNAYYPIKALSVIETLIFTGEIGVAVNSDTRIGADSFSGLATVATSSNALMRFDGFASGPLSKSRGLYYSAGLYLNFDPTNVPAPGRKFVDDKQIGQASLLWLGEASRLFASYRFSRCADNYGSGYSFAPFVFDGKGGISRFEGFRIGKDCYMPADDSVSWLDLADGTMKSGKLSRIDRRYLHDFTIKYDILTDADWELNASAHMCAMTRGNSAGFALASISRSASGYTLPEGEAYVGPVQTRTVTVAKASNYDYELLFEAKKSMECHRIHTGINLVISKQYEAGSTFSMAHSVAPDPQRLYYGGESTWDFNRSATYMDAVRRNLALYAMDTWQVNRDLRLRTGLRLRGVLNNTICAPIDLSNGWNDRSSGMFSLADASAHLVDNRLIGLDYALTEDMSWRLVDRLFAVAEGFYSITNKSTTYFKGANAPSVKPIGNAYCRGGLSYDNSWMDVTALVSFITSWNNAKVMTVSDHATGETIPWTAQYGIRTLGFILDGNVHFGGFKLHLMGTWQDPRYKDYRNEFNFGSGVKVLDYSGKLVTGISQFMAEIDPSFSWDRYRIWSSIRYYSRQYASRNNLAWFDGHFETFAGCEARIDAHNRVALNLVNVLGVNGAKGSVDFIDTLEDGSLLVNRLISGKYIRPFCVELSYTLAF